MRVAVLGAGLQGACVAMELVSAGVDVDLYDKEHACVTQASAQNEGKIHLGSVYGNDPSLNTARAMLRGALCFEELLRRWIGSDIDRIPVSAPFHYAVERDSLLGVDEVAHHLGATHELATSAGAGRSYFGSDYRMPPQRLSAAERDSLFDGRRVAAAFRTPEIAVDPEALATAVRARLTAEERIECRLRTRVRGVEATSRGLTVRFETAGVAAAETYDHVVNALWDGRLAIDRTMGLAPERPWLFRIKHYVRARAPGLGALLPSTTIVLGPFGDVVAYGDEVYLSWYPAGMRGMSSELVVPPWPVALGEHDAKELWHAVHGGLARLVPGLADITLPTVESWRARSGIIFAWGQSDIDDPDSGLHDRFAVGPHTHGNYHTIDTGKLTTAPLFGKQLADRIRQIGR